MDDITKTLTAYEDAFGPLPDSRLMSEQANNDIVELCKMAIKRGHALTDGEVGLADDVPDNVTI